MKVTVCELSNDPDQLRLDWEKLREHVQRESSEFVLLPEMPFYPWLARMQLVEPELWEASIQAHEEWLLNLIDLNPAVVAGTYPVIKEGSRFNEGFIWQAGSGYCGVHTKCFLPDEDGFWEASWYNRGAMDFTIADVDGVRIGFLICTEMWFSEHARAYGRDGIHLLLIPRATPRSSAEKWVAGGRTAAVTSGAFCLSSCFGGTDRNGMQWAGKGWIIDPEEGEVLALTSQSQPFVTLEIDLSVAERAKKTYPRYVRE